ncbi:MAG: DUF2911 domain-containing protein [Bacteroidota bacterium]
MKINNRKLAMLYIALLFGISQVFAQKNRPSPAKTAEGNIAGAKVTIKYSSPAVKGRTIWGDLVPYDAVWRAGANEATTFTTDKKLDILGNKLEAGTYSFFVIPKSDGKWTVIFNSDANQWGAYKYKESKDIVRIEVEAKDVEKLNERLDYKVEENAVTLVWERKSISIPIGV